MIVTAILAFGIARQEQPVPRIVATRYGEGKIGTGIHSHGYPVGKSGLILVNDGEPAYEIGVYPPVVALGTFKLHFENTIRRLTRDDVNAGEKVIRFSRSQPEPVIQREPRLTGTR